MNGMKRVVLASGNPGKVREINATTGAPAAVASSSACCAGSSVTSVSGDITPSALRAVSRYGTPRRSSECSLTLPKSAGASATDRLCEPPWPQLEPDAGGCQVTVSFVGACLWHRAWWQSRSSRSRANARMSQRARVPFDLPRSMCGSKHQPPTCSGAPQPMSSPSGPFIASRAKTSCASHEVTEQL